VATYVALLRGVNVGGKNTVPMADLRRVFESLGHGEVRTFIQSGNVVLTARRAVTPKSLEAAIAKELGVTTTVVLRTPAELEKVVKVNPFASADPSTLHVGFMVTQPPAASLAKLDGAPFEPDEFAVRGREIYFHLPNGMGRTKLPGYLDRRLTVPTTVRNWKTVNKLIELAAQ
jgi:uncharacterized protein (DUF1697 family)